MIWVYDNAIADDLNKSINAESGANDIVKVIDAGGVLALIAQMKEDRVQFPLMCLVRHPDTPVDNSLTNFSRIHGGVPVYYDDEKHNIYYEKAIPIKLEYDLVILGTSTVDVDELVREVLFKYTNMYLITTEIPYEAKRTIRFGVTISGEITRESGAFDYIQSGALHQAIVPLRCEGAMLFSYTPRHIVRYDESSNVNIDQDLK